jgi:hypothetical protein
VLFPVYKLNKAAIKWVLWLYPLVWIALALNEIVAIESESKRVNDFMFSVVFLVINPQTGAEVLWMVLPAIDYDYEKSSYIILLGIPFVLPAIITAVCAVLICIALLRKTTNTAAQNQMQKRRITVTVLLLTLTSLVFSCLYFVTELALVLYKPGIRFFRFEYYLLYFAGNVSAFLNSMITPIILVSRGSGIKEYLRSTLTSSRG